MTTPATYIGIDVAKNTLDVALRPAGEAFSLRNEQADIGGLIARLTPLDPALIVLEATGGLETTLAAALLAGGLPVVVVNPRQVREFARATGRLAKTDAIDAAVLARFGEAVQPQLRPLPEAASQELAALVARRRQLVAMLTAEKNRLRRATPKVRPTIEGHLSWSRAAWPRSIAIWTSPFTPRPLGAPMPNSSRARPVWDRSSRRCCWPVCRNWAA